MVIQKHLSFPSRPDRPWIGLCIPLLVLAPLSASAPPDLTPADAARLLSDPAALTDWVRQRHPGVQAAAARVEQARADLGAGHLYPNPSLGVQLSDVTVGAT